MSSNLISGYNRDLQDSKKPLIESLELTDESIKACNMLINNLLPQEEKMKSALTSEVFATHQALELVSGGIPFREAYQIVGSNMQLQANINIEKVLLTSTHLGGTGNLMLSYFDKKIKAEQ